MTVSDAKKFILLYQLQWQRHFDLLGKYIHDKDTSLLLKKEIDHLEMTLEKNRLQKNIANSIVLKDEFENAKKSGLTKTLESYLSKMRYTVSDLEKNGIDDSRFDDIRNRMMDDLAQVLFEREKKALKEKIKALSMMEKNAVYAASHAIYHHLFAANFSKQELSDRVLMAVAKRNDIDDAMRKQFVEWPLVRLPQKFFEGKHVIQWQSGQILFSLELIRHAYTSNLSEVEKKSETKQKKIADLNNLISLMYHRISQYLFVRDDLDKLIHTIASSRIKKSLCELQAQIKTGRIDVDAILAPVSPGADMAIPYKQSLYCKLH